MEKRKLSLSAVIHKEEDTYIAECPEVGTVSQGETLTKAIENLREATELYLEEFPLVSKEKAIMTTFEVAAHARLAKRSVRARNY